jgi:hypothetical protein
VDSVDSTIRRVIDAVASTSARLTVLGPEPQWHTLRYRLIPTCPDAAGVDVWSEDDVVQVCAGQSQFEIPISNRDLAELSQELEGILEAIVAGGLVEEASVTFGGCLKSSRSQLRHGNKVWKARSLDFWMSPLPTLRKVTRRYSPY